MVIARNSGVPLGAVCIDFMQTGLSLKNLPLIPSYSFLFRKIGACQSPSTFLRAGSYLSRPSLHIGPGRTPALCFGKALCPISPRSPSLLQALFPRDTAPPPEGGSNIPGVLHSMGTHCHYGDERPQLVLARTQPFDFHPSLPHAPPGYSQAEERRMYCVHRLLR